MSSQLNKSVSNKKLNYALLALVAILWGGIMYKFFFKNTAEVSSNLNPLIESPKETAEALQKETYDLLLNYPDPFDVKRVESKPKKKAVLAKKPVKQTIQPKYIQWPILNYYGMAKNKETNEKIAIISINGQSVLLSEKSSKKDVMMNAIYNDSVVVVFTGVKKTIVKEIK